MVDFSSAQERALDLSTHVAITAAAGSGKTTVLVERIIKILEKNDFRPEQIVAITFTEEAAAQIKEGLRRKMEEKILPSNGVDPGWEEVYPLLSLAKITTIHGFCFTLLKEYPLEAGLDPGFSVLSAGEQKLRLLECIRQSLHDLSDQFDPPLETLLEYVPRALLEPIFSEMIERRSYLGQFVTGRPGDSAEWLEPLRELYRRETAQVVVRLNIWNELKEFLSQLPAELLGEVDSCSRRCTAQRDLFLQRGKLDADRFVEKFCESLAIQVNPSRKWKESSWYAPLKRLWSTVRRELRKYPLGIDVSEQETRHFTKALVALHSIYTRILKNYQERKAKDSVLDFEDLLAMTARLVSQDRVSRTLVQRYRFLLVDEFQDTNYLQWEILRRLVGASTNFFAVGDAKQSIYRFRDADVTVFRELQSWVRSTGQLVEMSDNYRSLPSLVEFNNRLFKHLLQPGLDYEAVYQEMQPYRVQEPTRSKPPCVESFFYDAPPAGEASFEAGQASSCVDRLVREEGFRYSDIAILLRTRARLKEYEEALRGANVPFYTVGGIGFYERQEVLDLVNLLRFLTNLRNDIALLGILRSPFFNLSDEDLFLLSLAPGAGYWQKLQNAAQGALAGKVTADGRSWEFAVQRLQAWIEESREQPMTAFLRGAVEETGYLEVVSASPRGAQNSRNIRKFLDLVRAFEKDRSRSFRELLRFMDAFMKQEAKEAEAMTSEDVGEVVRIYTIHGAKGLQFPVVILPELGHPLFSRRKNLFYFHSLRQRFSSQTFFSLKIWNPDKGYRDLEHAVHKMLQRLDEFRQIAEEKRLLYVGTTRARDRLVLMGRRTRSLSYARWLCESGVEASSVRFQAGAESIDQSRQVASKTGVIDPPTSFLDIHPGRAVSEKKVWTPTELALFSRCPYKFYLSRIERLTEDPPFSWYQDERTEALVGSAIHEMLEGPTLKPVSVEARLQKWRRKNRNLLSSEKLNAIEERVRRQLKQVAAHPFYERLSRAQTVHSEKPFHVREGGVIITGVIDKLFQERGQQWVVVDFKTGEVMSSQIDAKIRQEAYDLQVEVYLWAISRVLSTNKVRGFLFFTHTGDLAPIGFGPDVARKCEDLIASLPRPVQASRFPKTRDASYCYPCGYYRQGLCPGGGVPSSEPEQRSLW